MRQSTNSINNAALYIQTIQSIDGEYLYPIDKSADRHYFEVVWIVKGKGTCLIDLEEFEMCDNIFFCLRPGQAYQLLANGDVLGYNISFTESFFLYR